MDSLREVDLLIIGAGLHGIIMGKTYLQVHPSANVLVVDEAQSVGGTWARERLYPGLKTNNIFGSYELSDYPLMPERYGVDGTGHIPGHVVHAYLRDVAQDVNITPHLMLQNRVTLAALQADGRWMVRLDSIGEFQQSPEDMEILAHKLVIATGLTSKPNIPRFPGSDSFQGIILHSKQLKEQADSLAQRKQIVVLGGNKSAWDVCYAAARSGSQVHMVIRPSGGGPSYLWPREFSIGQFTGSLAKLSATRVCSLLDPTPFGQDGPWSWIRRMIHQTSIGQRIVHWFWKWLDNHIRKINGYHTHLEVKKLEPWTTPFWMGNSLSIHNYETDWFDLVRQGKIHVHITDISSLSASSIYLANGETLDADALVLCTGWTTDNPVCFDRPQKAIPVCRKNDHRTIEAIYQSIPYLRCLLRRSQNAPLCREVSDSKAASPIAQLYRHIVPSDQEFMQHKSLAFIGMAASIHAVIVAQAQALWITSFFDDRIEHLRPENIDYDAVGDSVILHREYGRLRRPRETGGLAGRHADLVFDTLPYVDVLLGDLGVASKRKQSWWRELVEAYGPRDYQGLVDEWIRVQGGGISHVGRKQREGCQ